MSAPSVILRLHSPEEKEDSDTAGTKIYKSIHPYQYHTVIFTPGSFTYSVLYNVFSLINAIHDHKYSLTYQMCINTELIIDPN